MAAAVSPSQAARASPGSSAYELNFVVKHDLRKYPKFRVFDAWPKANPGRQVFINLSIQQPPGLAASRFGQSEPGAAWLLSYRNHARRSVSSMKTSSRLAV